jgi:hypothetical protein
MKVIAASLILAALVLAPASASDPLSSLRFLEGSWKCTYQAGGTPVYYKAVYAYDMSGNWLRETDAWKGGGSDLGMITYEPRRHGWAAVVMEQDRTTVIFRAGGNNPNHVVYRSVYPDATMTDIFDRVSPTRYALHFTQSIGHKTMRSTDVCEKT